MTENPNARNLLNLLKDAEKGSMFRKAEEEMANWLGDTKKGWHENISNQISLLRRFSSPLVTEALELYERESRHEATRIIADLYERYPEGCPDNVKRIINEKLPFQELFKTPCEKQDAIRVYYSGLCEAFRKLPKEYIPDSTLLGTFLDEGLKRIHADESFKPWHFFKILINAFYECVTRNMLTMNETYIDQQKKKAQKGAQSRWISTSNIKSTIQKLAVRRDALGEYAPAKELWPEFFAELDQDQLEPVEEGNRITWRGNPSGITLKTFTNKISAIRSK